MVRELLESTGDTPAEKRETKSKDLVGRLLVRIRRKGNIKMEKANNKEKTTVIEGISFNESLNKAFMSDKFIKIIKAVFSGIIIFQFAAICYLNFFQMDKHLGYDASSLMLKSTMMWEQKTLFPTDFDEQTNLCFDSSIIPSALFYGITGNIMTAFAITNIITTLTVIALVYTILKQLGVGVLPSLAAVAMLLTPYVPAGYNIANSLEYYPGMYFSSAFFSLTTILSLTTFKIMLNFDRKVDTLSSKLLILYHIILLVIVGMGRGLALFMYIIAPCCLSIFVQICTKKDFSGLFSKKTAYTIFSAVVVILSKKYVVDVLNFESKENSMNLIGLSDFWGNFGRVFLGFGKLLAVGSIGSDTLAISKPGIYQLINSALLVFIVFSIIYTVVRFIRTVPEERDYGVMFAGCFCFVNFFGYALLDSTYGSAIFEERYMIQFYVFSVFFVGLCAEHYDNGSFFKRFILIAVSSAVLLSSACGYYIFNLRKSTASIELKNILSKYDADIIYGYYIPGSNINIVTRNLRVLDKSKLYKLIDNGKVHHWGDYTYGDDAYYNFEGNNLMLIMNEQFEELPDYVKNAYELCEVYTADDFNYGIYEAQKNVFDFQLGLPDSGTAVDYPYTDGVFTQNVFLNEDGYYTSDGTEGYCVFGPYAQTKSGKYDITIIYKVIESNSPEAAVYDIATDFGANILDNAPLTSDKESITLSVEFTGNETFEYRVYNLDGSKVEIKYFIMEKKD